MENTALLCDPYNVIITGVGGQGNVLISQLKSLSSWRAENQERYGLTPLRRTGIHTVSLI